MAVQESAIGAKMNQLTINHFEIDQSKVYESIEAEDWTSLGIDTTDADFVVVEIINGAFKIVAIKAEEHYICQEEGMVRVFSVC